MSEKVQKSWNMVETKRKNLLLKIKDGKFTDRLKAKNHTV